MNINWYGQGCFRIQTKKTNILIDPFDPKESGLRAPHLKDEIILINQPDKEYHFLKKVEGAFLISTPGEYEIKDTFIYSFYNKEEYPLLIYRIETENMSIAHLGEINHLLSDEVIGQLDGIDILMIPVGGKNLLTAEKAAELASQLEPKIIIPMYYHLPGLKINLEKPDKFYKEMGVKKNEMEKLNINKNKFPPETEIVILKP